ncbi:hypothetical protein CC78DRAFT_600002 [Lojkania enalia]|uniref:Uncharacterized protein n=1 Tax=Lojkania enalia TaxID=147567 RepID=A0A9P4KAY2_9PLEO|nr:hypothetical protein CC78DRAFT_600002 [Didymosphaeria enalia]
MSPRNEPLTTHAANNGRLYKAIEYMKYAAHTDSYSNYQDRVRKIDNYILKQYVEEGYSYDAWLYRQLQAMVREAQSDFRYDAEGELYDSYTEDSGAEEVGNEPALYRGTEHGGATRIVPSQTHAVAPSRRPLISTSTLSRKILKLADVREYEWKYGGPNNESEEWHKEFPPALPFDENLHMQKLESLIIDYESRESSRKKPRARTRANDKDSELSPSRQFDTGSMFKLPNIKPELQKYLDNQDFDLKGVIQRFNECKDKDYVWKGYVPRIFLEQLAVNSKDKESPSHRPQSGSMPHSPTIPTAAGPSGTQPRPTSSFPTQRSSVSLADPQPKQASLLSTRGSIERRPSTTSTTKRMSSSDTFSPQADEVSGQGPYRLSTDSYYNKFLDRQKATQAGTPGKTIMRRLSHVAPSLAKAGPQKTVTPTPSKRRAKRTIEDADDSYEEAVVKRTKIVPSKTRPIRTKKVTFQKEVEVEPAAKTTAKKPAPETAPKKSTPTKKTAAKKTRPLLGLAPKNKLKPRGLLEPTSPTSLKRGITRSGLKFK